MSSVMSLCMWLKEGLSGYSYGTVVKHWNCGKTLDQFPCVSRLSPMSCSMFLKQLRLFHWQWLVAVLLQSAKDQTHDLISQTTKLQAERQVVLCWVVELSLLNCYLQNCSKYVPVNVRATKCTRLFELIMCWPADVCIIRYWHLLSLSTLDILVWFTVHFSM